MTDDNRTDLQRAIDEQIEAGLKNLFGRFPDSIDWAEDMAREIVVKSFDLNDSIIMGLREYDKDPNYAPRQDLAFSLATAFALQIRHMRSDFHREAEAAASSKLKSFRKKMRGQFAAPSFLCELIRDKASGLDERGWSAEAGVLREAAAILEEND